MIDLIWKHARRGGWAAALLVLQGATPLLAQEVDVAKPETPPAVAENEAAPSMAELKERLEKLEQANQELRLRLEQVAPSAPAEGQLDPNIQPVYFQANNEDPSGVGSTVPDHIRRAVEDYLTKKDGKDKLDKDYKEVGNKPLMFGKYDNGWLLESPNKAFSIRCGVECQADMAFLAGSNAMEFGPGGVGDVTNGVNIRRGRLDARGTIYENFEYMIQYDFNLATAVRTSPTQVNVFNTPQPTEFWGMLTHLPVVRNIRIGNQKPLWSFENWTSSRFQNFMERSFGWDAFVEDQDNGFLPSIVMLNWTENERATMQLGIGKNSRSAFFYNQQDGNNMVEGRVSFLPVYLDNGRYLVHIGCGGMYGDSDRDTVRYRARTLVRNGSNQTQNILTESRFFATNESRLVPELCIQLGSFYIQAEYYMAWADDVRTIANPNTNLGTFFGKSYYVQAMYFLTGEHNPYNKQLGRWERIIPHSNFFWMNGSCGRIFSQGCWLTGFRYSYIDLRDLGGVNGANTTPLGNTPSSAGVYNIDWCTNWILNPNARIMADVTYGVRTTANTPGSNGPYGGFGMRLQFDF